MIVPIGGGGLCAGVASAVKLASPGTLVFGVEPEGADSMHRSFAAGSPQAIDAVRTIADSLGAPYAAPYSFGLCRRYVDELVLVSDDELRRAMHLLFASAKLAVEPAGRRGHRRAVRSAARAAARPARGRDRVRRQHRPRHVRRPDHCRRRSTLSITRRMLPPRIFSTSGSE